jgi:hypothetical protein
LVWRAYKYGRPGLFVSAEASDQCDLPLAAKRRRAITRNHHQGRWDRNSGYFFNPEQKQWKLISSWKAPTEGGYLRGLYSFSENFGGANGHLRRKALFGNQWVRTDKGRWIELTTASFSHDATGRTDRLDRFMGVESGQFFLSQGGFIPGYTRYGEKFERPATGKPPEDITLPEPPIN